MPDPVELRYICMVQLNGRSTDAMILITGMYLRTRTVLVQYSYRVAYSVLVPYKYTILVGESLRVECLRYTQHQTPDAVDDWSQIVYIGIGDTSHIPVHPTTYEYILNNTRIPEYSYGTDFTHTRTFVWLFVQYDVAYKYR